MEGFLVGGIMADIGHVRHMRWVQDDSPASPINQPPTGSTAKAEAIAKARWVSYNRMRGKYAIAMEHATPEQFFVDKSQCGKTGQPVCQQAISAVKALQIAAAEGQKIYTITQANFSSALPKISLSSAAREEIRNAVAAGKEVTIHERPIHAFGWSGSGYAVVDPETGAGAYMIDGGANGSWGDFVFIEGASLFSIGVICTVGIAVGVITGVAVSLVLFSILIGLSLIAMALMTGDVKWDNVKGALASLGSAIIAVFSPSNAAAQAAATLRDAVGALAALALSIAAAWW